MEKLGKDVIGLIFEKMTPADWWSASLVCKSWWQIIQKWLKIRKNQFIKCLKNEITLLGINLIEEKGTFCIRPMYYLQGVGIGCRGEISNYVCARHKLLSTYNREICEICLKNPSSDICFGNRCNSLKCRDYMHLLRGGKAKKVKAYNCQIPLCQKFTDTPKGYCYQHALTYTTKNEINLNKRYQCTANTQNGNRCTIKTNSRCGKCHHHAFSPLSLI